MYLLDTNICIFAIKDARANKHSHIMEMFRQKRISGLGISAITLAELEHGVANSGYPARNAAALMSILVALHVHPFDERAASEYGRIRADLQRRGAVIGALDMLIASHAKALGKILVTNNTREFRRIEGLDIEDWTVP